MAREEEIKKQANKSADKYADSIGEWSHHRMGFINGAKWADRTMIDKACEWLENKACLYIWKNCEQGEHGIHKTMLEDFRKAMKGE